MTRSQKVALLNLVVLVLLAALWVLEELDILDNKLKVMLFVLFGLAGLIGAIVIIAHTSLKKTAVDDERDRLYGNRSFIAAYFTLWLCVLAGPFAAVLTFHGEAIPLKFVFIWAGGSWLVSVLVQSAAVLIQYKIRIKNNS